MGKEEKEENGEGNRDEGRGGKGGLSPGGGRV